MPLFVPVAGLLAPFDTVTSFQALLMSAGRFLLTLAMSLFVSYLIFVIGSVLVSVVSRQLRVLTSRPDDDRRVARQRARAGGRLPALVGVSAPDGGSADNGTHPHGAVLPDAAIQDATLSAGGGPDAEHAEDTKP
ncbi:MAG TPA: hypothetical protein VK095_10490 [Beutenbergiaceae bacterium]|nr:hypothetical protein [Beutenbergiaceae bacterium]